jgi:hypothetical protein
MSENVGASTYRNPKGLHGLYRDNFTLPYIFILMVRSSDVPMICVIKHVFDTLLFEIQEKVILLCSVYFCAIGFAVVKLYLKYMTLNASWMYMLRERHF